MNRAFETRFKFQPELDAPRSIFDLSKKHMTTFNVGDLCPIYLKDIYPGDTFNVKTSYVVRTTTPIKAPMDVSYLDTYFFFVPMRLVWEHTKEFFGENPLTPWENPTEYTIPQLTSPAETGWHPKSLACMMGLARPNTPNLSISALPLRAVALIVQEWFRDQNVQEGIMVNKDDATQAGTNGTDMSIDTQLGGKLPRVNRFKDYFSSALPEPQRGPEVFLPLGTTAPVIGNGTSITVVDGVAKSATLAVNGSGHLGNVDYEAGKPAGESVGSNPWNVLTNDRTIGLTTDATASGMVADLTQAASASISAVRQAFAVKQLMELSARGGARYNELIYANFGVQISDATVQRPEYLGGNRQPMNISQVVQMSGTTETSPQGNIAGYSLTIDSSNEWTKSFEEWGFVIGFACVRCNHTYQQGIPRFASFKERLDFMWPTLEGIGDQPIYNRELFAKGTEADEEVFGYQERYAEHRMDFNTIAGEFRDDYEQSLKAWQYADYYEEQPILSQEWMLESPNNMDKTLQVTSEVADQIHADFYFEVKATRRMSMFGIPGLTRM